MAETELAQTIRLVVPSHRDMLGVVRRTTEEICRLAGLGPSQGADVVLAVHEAACNSVVHAHGGRTEMPIKIAYTLSQGELTISVADQGPPFDFDSAPQLDPTEFRAGGRGLFLIRSIMDEVTSCPPNDGWNELQMVKRW